MKQEGLRTARKTGAAICSLVLFLIPAFFEVCGLALGEARPPLLHSEHKSEGKVSRGYLLEWTRILLMFFIA